MVEERDPLRVLLRSVRRVGADYCWPATQILEVLEAFEQLERVVLGAELWRFEEASAPTVIGWTEFLVPEGAWHERVTQSRRLAADELLGYAGDGDAWVNVTWEDRGHASD